MPMSALTPTVQRHLVVHAEHNHPRQYPYLLKKIQEAKDQNKPEDYEMFTEMLRQLVVKMVHDYWNRRRRRLFTSPEKDPKMAERLSSTVVPPKTQVPPEPEPMDTSPSGPVVATPQAEPVQAGPSKATPTPKAPADQIQPGTSQMAVVPTTLSTMPANVDDIPAETSQAAPNPEAERNRQKKQEDKDKKSREAKIAQLENRLSGDNDVQVLSGSPDKPGPSQPLGDPRPLPPLPSPYREEDIEPVPEGDPPSEEVMLPSPWDDEAELPDPGPEATYIEILACYADQWVAAARILRSESGRDPYQFLVSVLRARMAFGQEFRGLPLADRVLTAPFMRRLVTLFLDSGLLVRTHRDWTDLAEIHLAHRPSGVSRSADNYFQQICRTIG
ncbi:uncharacterized protein LOC129601847 [Paramacrobiotus metropolitanus]|uniref:uncharacterized protein LOC129601847 n=1 Tax=Paramacrobiotus metropolitanus TaxID=2943436 RepID=UPI00244617A8|nr:uncharacterized protein LOC129601847 [Paramacrobiotus metropolitanus]